MKYFRFLFGIVLLFLVLPSFAQEDENDSCKQTMDKNTEKLFKRARDLQKNGKKDEAYSLYNEIIETNPDYLEVNYYYALGYYLPWQMNQYQSSGKSSEKAELTKAYDAFNRIFNICPTFKIQVDLYAARLSFYLEKYADAIKFANVILENQDLLKATDSSSVDEAMVIIKRAKFYNNILNSPVPFDPKPVEGISTSADEYLGTLSPDGEYFYFTRRVEEKDNRPFSQGETISKEYFSYSKAKNHHFDAGGPVPFPFNQSEGEGSPTINLTNDMLIFTKLTNVTNNGTTYPNYDLYYSTFVDGDWTEPKSLGPNINRSDSWESQASLSSDGKILFFASDRPGGYGGSDIWYAERNSDGTWRKPVNLGPTINTDRNERSPFLHTDSKTLYFSSSGHDCVGGQDIFYSKLDSKNQWSKPVNIGYPINSGYDDVNFFVSLDGKTGYFSSNKIENKDWNIYQFDLYEAARPHNMMIVKGSVSADDGDLDGATVEIRDTSTKVIATGIVNAQSGLYAVATEIHKENPQPLIVNVKKSGHSYDSQIIMPEQMDSNIVTKNAEVKAIETGKVCDLHDIYFETNSYTLTPGSKVIVDMFIDFLRDNPTVKVEIQGYTDNVGNDQDNLKLSQNRAQSVYDYAISKQISSSRLRYKGYGESSPIASNDTAAGRAKNRRTVFLIYDK